MKCHDSCCADWNPDTRDCRLNFVAGRCALWQDNTIAVNVFGKDSMRPGRRRAKTRKPKPMALPGKKDIQRNRKKGRRVKKFIINGAKKNQYYGGLNTESK